MARQFGGTFAPPLSDEILAKYRQQIDALPADSMIRDVCDKLHTCCHAWWNAPDSNGPGKRHPSGKGMIVPLDEGIAKQLFDVIPWDKELEAYQKVLDGIDPVADRDLRNMAFHLLWHAKELEMDREPITADKV